jgi:hypothetical protein
VSGTEPIDLSQWSPGPATTRKRKTTNRPAEPDDQLDKVRDAANSKTLAKKSVDEIAEMAVRRAANVFLLGGDSMLPTTATEASNVAKTWAAVRALEKNLKSGTLTDVEEAVAAAKDNLRQLRARVKK